MSRSTLQVLMVDSTEPLVILEYDAETPVLVGDEIEIPGRGEFRVVRRRWSFPGADRHLVVIVERLV